MPSQTPITSEHLWRLIETSVLLTDDRREKLLAILEQDMSATRMQELETLLLSEDTMIRDIARRAITRAVEEGDEEFLAELDRLITDGMKRVRREGEAGERSKERTTVDHFFDEHS